MENIFVISEIDFKALLIQFLSRKIQVILHSSSIINLLKQNLSSNTIRFCFKLVILNDYVIQDVHFQTFKVNALFNFYIGAEDGENYLVGIIVLAVLLAMSLVILAYFIYKIHRLKSSKANPENKRKDRNNSKDIYENPDKVEDDVNYEDVEKEQSTYKGLENTGKDENDDHVYSDLNEVHKDYVNQKETGI